MKLILINHIFLSIKLIYNVSFRIHYKLTKQFPHLNLYYTPRLESVLLPKLCLHNEISIMSIMF